MRGREDHAVALLGGELDQPPLFAAHVREALGSWYADQLAFDVIDPGMEGAGEAARLVSAAGLDNPSAAMLAHVEKGAYATTLVSSEEHRRAGGIESHPRAGAGEVTAEADEHRIAVEYDPAFLLELIERRIPLERLLQDMRSHGRGLLVDISQGPAGYVPLSLQVHVSRSHPS